MEFDSRTFKGKFVAFALVKIGQNVTTLFATTCNFSYLQLHLDIFATISYVDHICDSIVQLVCN
jgi:hypothetical protein